MKAIIEKKLIQKPKKLANLIKDVVKRQNMDFNDDQHLNELIELISKSFKSQSDIEMIRMAFVKFKFFLELESQMGQEYVLQLYKELSYEKMESREVVFHLGDIGRKFYIILKGSVWILVKKKNLHDGTQHEEESVQKPVKKKKHNKRKSTQKNVFMTQNKNDQNFDDEDYSKLTDEQFIETKFPDFIKVGQMTSGASFGEIALHNSMPRTATIVCAEDCHFAILTRETFKRMLSEYYEFLKQNNLRFLKQISMFSEWNEPMLNQIYYHFQFKDLKINDVIYKENDNSTYIYLVKEGEVEISKNLEINMRSPTEAESLLLNFASPGMKKYNCKYKRIRQALISQGQVFGQEEILAGTKRTSMAICVSNKVQLFILDKERFINYCQRGGAVEKLSKFTNQKQGWRQVSESCVKNIENPPYSNQDENQNDLVKTQLIHKRNFSEEKIKVLKTDDQLKKQSIISQPEQKIFMERVSDKLNVNSFYLLQNKTHQTNMTRNFNFHFDLIKKVFTNEKQMDITSSLFEFDDHRKQNAKKYFLQDSKSMKSRLGRDSKHLVKSLKLPSIIHQFDTRFSGSTYEIQLTEIPEKEEIQITKRENKTFIIPTYTTEN